MKIGNNGPLMPEVHLPAEIIATIIRFTSQPSEDDSQQQDLWACCLVSKDWYAATVSHLYDTPHLGNKNFDKFARTICPPVTSNIRHIGLETFIKHLDMGMLAYESSKSLTARLLRRTKTSLETFVAPAVSFSVNCLAPLSKCIELRCLDLSKDFYDIDLNQLLHAIGHLEHLYDLSLPKSALRKRFNLNGTSRSTNSWPPNLRRLQINDWLPTDAMSWIDMMHSWPETLRSLAFYDCYDYHSFWQLHHAGASCEHITTVEVGLPRCEDIFPVVSMTATFPKLRNLSLPAISAPIIDHDYELSKGRGTCLIRLIFSPSTPIMPQKITLSSSFLREYVLAYPKLRKLELPESCIDLEDVDEMSEVQALEMILNRRAGIAKQQRAGIFFE